MDGWQPSHTSPGHRSDWARLPVAPDLWHAHLTSDRRADGGHVRHHRHHAWYPRRVLWRADRCRRDVRDHLPPLDPADPRGFNRGSAGRQLACGGYSHARATALGTFRRGGAHHHHAAAQSRLHRRCAGCRRVADASPPARSASQYRQSPGGGGDAGNGARDPARSGLVIPRARRSAAFGELGADDRGGQGVHVLQPVGNRDPRRALFVLVLGINLLGDGLRDMLGAGLQQWRS